jgi:hypothetical protein
MKHLFSAKSYPSTKKDWHPAPRYATMRQFFGRYAVGFLN